MHDEHDKRCRGRSKASQYRADRLAVEARHAKIQEFSFAKKQRKLSVLEFACWKENDLASTIGRMLVWEEEHGVTIVIRNGEPVGLGHYDVDVRKYDRR